MWNFNVGETAIVAVQFVNEANQGLAATGVVIKARKPDGSVVNGTVTAGSGTGQYEARFVTDLPGTWLTKAECSGPEVAKDEARFVVSRLQFDS